LVTILTAAGRPVANKTVTLSQGGGHSVIHTISGVTNASGVATFEVSDTTAEGVTYSATDATDSVILRATARVSFSRPIIPEPPRPCGRGGLRAR
jgi:hypothetical protein